MSDLTYQNPFLLENQWNGNQLGDPFMMRFCGYTYLYCSSSGCEIKCWKSENMVDFQYIGSVCDLPEIDGAYAPEVCYSHGKFWMITSPKGSGHYILCSKSPEGPFVLATENFGALIDGSFFIDDTGEHYLLRAGHKGIEIHDVKLNNSETAEVNLHSEIIPESYLGMWTEGPMIIKKDGYYFLTYTGNHLLSKGYRVCYAVSENSPETGYKTPHNNILILETDDECHALGHSSTVIAPDLDSYYLAYHSFDFRPEKPFRSLNIDRIFFNGERMYCTPTRQEQKAPDLPKYLYRNGNGQEIINGSYILPVKARFFNAEICYNGDENTTFDIGGIITVEIKNAEFIVKFNDTVYTRTIPNCIDLNSILTLKISIKPENLIELSLNGLYLLRETSDCLKSISEIQELKITRNTPPLFCASSEIPNPSFDGVIPKPLPGKFDFVHYSNSTGTERIPVTDNGLKINGIKINKNSELVYSVNTAESGEYLITMRVKSNGSEKIAFTVNQTDLFIENAGNVQDCDGFRIVTAGKITLDKGCGKVEFRNFSVSENTDLILDYVEISRYSEVRKINAVNKGQLKIVDTDDIKILGHKNKKSMIKKVYGFTCAENHGEAFIGESGWTDYVIRSSININTETNGEISLFLRATKESWFAHQVKSSFLGYRVLLNKNSITLSRCAYDDTELVKYSCAFPKGVSLVRLDAEVRGNEIAILLNGLQVIMYSDPLQFSHGKAGFEAVMEGWGFEEFEVNLI